MIYVEVGEGGCEICEVLQRLNNLNLAISERCSEGTVIDR